MPMVATTRSARRAEEVRSRSHVFRGLSEEEETNYNEQFQALIGEAGPDTWEDERFGVRLAFFGRTEASVRLRILEGRRSRLEERVDALKTSLARTRERLDSYTLELQQHGLESVEREVRWLDELIASEREHPQHDTAAPSGQSQHTTSGAGNQPSAHGV